MSGETGVGRLSVVIANYNYERFVGAAIESALALRWPDVEVVVVDDGSTDDSLRVIRGFGDRVRVLATENGSQRVAVNRGFEASTGDVVIFLDSDDLLPPDLPRQLESVWGPSVSKAQFQMQRIDDNGRELGKPFPDYDPVPSPADIQLWASRTSAYPTPPGSGNAYARWFLDQVLPVGDSVGDAADSALLAAAPFLGDVVSVPGAVVGYRRHGGNDSDLMRDVTRFPREVARARARWRLALGTVGGAGDDIDERPLFRSRELLQLRVAARRMVPGAETLPGDGFRRVLVDAFRSPWHPGPEPWRRRVAIASWCLATLVVPSVAARWLVGMRYGQR